MAKGWSFPLLACLLGFGWAADAKAQPKGQIVALFMLPNGDPKPALVASLAKNINAYAAERQGLTFLAGSPLRKKLGRKPMKAVLSCGADLKCLAKIARKAGAVKLLYLRVMADDEKRGGVVAQVLLVGGASKSIEHRSMFRADSVGSIADKMNTELQAMFPIPKDSPELELEGVGVESLELVSLEGISADEGRAGDARRAPLADIDALVPIESGSAPGVKRDLSDPGSLGSVGYTGIAVAGVGLVVGGIGVALGVKSRSIADSIVYGPDGDSQLEGLRKRKRSHDKSQQANLLFAGAAVALVTGGSLLAIDLFRGRRSGTRVLIAPAGRGGGVRGELSVIW